MPFEPSPSLSPLVPLCNRGRFAEGLLCATSGHTIGSRDVLEQYVNQEMRRGEH